MSAMGFFGFLFALFILGFSVVLSVLISQPFTGALVRLRANYLPKAVSLDNVLEDGAEYSGSGAPASGVRGVTPRAISGFFLRQQQNAAKIGPVVSGIVSMLFRTKRLEGWPGIYKGSAPVVCQLFVLGFAAFVMFNAAGVNMTGGGTYRSAPSRPGQFSFWGNLWFMIVTSIVALPLNVITNRAIVHPRVMSFRNARENLRELLSFSEYSQPWRLYLLPGLLATELSHVFWIGFVTRLVRHWTVPSLGGLPASTPANPGDDTYTGPGQDGTASVSTFGLAVFLAWCVLSVVILSPLECVMIRLSVQRPERQQPLHMAYARVAGNSGGAQASGPASYNDQAQVPQSGSARNGVGAAGEYSDAPAAASAEPSDPAPRPSFTIDDEDEEGAGVESGSGKRGDEERRPLTGTKDAANLPKNAANGRANGAANQQQQSPAAHRVLGNNIPSSPSSTPLFNGNEPSEPVIALRPCDEPLSAEEAARAEAEGFGAPIVERYEGMVDCLNKLVDEEGIEALYRGAWVTLLGVLAGNFS